MPIHLPWRICGRVAQLAEHSALNRQVEGSIPSASTIPIQQLEQIHPMLMAGVFPTCFAVARGEVGRRGLFYDSKKAPYHAIVCIGGELTAGEMENRAKLGLRSVIW